MSHSQKPEVMGASTEVFTQVRNSTPVSKILDPSHWSRKEYMFLIAGVLIQAFVYSFEVNLMYNCLPYVTNLLQATSLASVLPTILQILSAALVPFYTKVSDVFGRAQSLTFAMVFYIVGYIIQGTTKSFLQLALGQIFYGIGSTGMLTLTQVLIADTTSLLNRGIVFSLWDLPSAMNIFTTTLLADPLTSYPGANWRNVYIIVSVLSAFGAIAVLTPLWYLQRKAQNRGVTLEHRSIGWLLHEFDAVGALLITLAMSLSLLPMILAKSFEGNWENPKILGMFCSGIVCYCLLVFWEVKYTNRPIMPMRIWTNPTCFGGLIVMFFMTVMPAMNWQYYTYYLMVSRNLTLQPALMLERGYQVAYLVFQTITGLLMRRFKILRPFIWIGIIVHTIGIGLMIPARAPDSSDAFVVLSQTIVGAAGGMANIAASVAVTGAVDRKDVAVVVGVTQILGSFGSAFGSALAGGVWTQYLPKRLAKRVTGPYDEFLAVNDITYIAGLDPTTKRQMIEAWGDSQKLMSILSVSLAAFACICTLFMKHVDLTKDQNAEELEAAAAEGKEEFIDEPGTTYNEKNVVA
ncbi:major facilitator superfamily domain-containing protein [Linnemannia elongata]|nr:major facilitator superfamily domain-containing protein [Linnemannia elongata]